MLYFFQNFIILIYFRYNSNSTTSLHVPVIDASTHRDDERVLLGQKFDELMRYFE
jgi:hypothetical protein